MNKGLGLALTGAACIGIWAVWPVPRAQPRASAAGEQQASGAETLRAVETRLARVEHRQWSATNTAAALPPPAAATATVPPPASPEAPPKSSSELEADYERRFRDEPEETRASRDASQRLADALAGPELAGSSLQGVRCGPSLCRLEVRHEDALARQRFDDDFPTAIPWQTTGLIRFVDEHTSLVYLATPEL